MRKVRPEEVACWEQVVAPRARDCFRVLALAGGTVIHHTGALWCPIAKVGSESIKEALKINTVDKEGRPVKGFATGSVLLAHSLSLEQRKNLCESSKPHLTFTVTRDPYDRLASAYLDKVVLGSAGGMVEVRRLLSQRYGPTPSFRQFVSTLAEMPLALHDVHSLPYSTTCKPATLQYDVLTQLTDLDRDMERIFAQLGAGGHGYMYTPSHATAALHQAHGVANRSIAAFGLRPDVLELHGMERVQCLYDAAAKKVVREGWWKEDVAAFTVYHFDDDGK
jgi:hypothetical protein